MIAAPERLSTYIHVISMLINAPTSDGSHVGLDPGFIDEDETGRINPRLIFFPARAAARHVGAILLGRQHAFFEAHSLAMDEIPDRAIADGNAAFGEFRHEPAHGHLGLGPLPPPPFEQSPRSLGEVAAHFQEFWEVLSGDIIVLANTSEHGRLVFPPQNRGIVIYVAGIVLRATLR